MPPLVDGAFVVPDGAGTRRGARSRRRALRIRALPLAARAPTSTSDWADGTSAIMSELFPGFDDAPRSHLRRGDPLRDRRQRPAAAAAARLSADARDVAPDRAARSRERFTVVCADLRGYGDSSKPARRRRARRLLEARDGAGQVEVMRALGFARFRAGRPRPRRARRASAVRSIIRDAVERVAVLDISPTRIMYAQTDQAFATAYYHWFFLIQPFDLPERLIGADPVYYLRRKLGGWGSAAAITSTRARSPNTSAAFATRRRSTRPARTTARRRRSISSTTRRRRRRPQGRRARCSCCGARRAWCNRLFDPIDDWSRGRARRARASAAVRALPRRGGAGARRWPSCTAFFER